MYAESYPRDVHKRHLGIPIASVLTLATTEARADAMRKAWEGLVMRPGKVPPELFLLGGMQPNVDILEVQ